MSLHTALVKIEEEKISSEKAKKFIASEKNGAESIFIGRVRNENSGKKVTAVTFFPLFSFLTLPIKIDSAPFFSEAINFFAFSEEIFSSSILTSAVCRLINHRQ